MSFQSVLIANRGEIACRVIRSLKELGLRSIAVYSDADKDASHVKLADDAVHIGGSPASESYLAIDKIIAAAKESGAQAIHPGYGFLSENADFAKQCGEANLIFIGPSPAAITLMGDKAAAKRHMIAAGVPVLQGYQDKKQDNSTLLEEAGSIGFPLMVKAAAGGGGRGMRLVTTADDLPTAISTARAEALSAFGSDTLILERAVIRPRHVEIQVFGDNQGHIIHLGERDCSVQRRHQKVLEEAPCPVMTDKLRAKMGEAAVQAAQSVNYVGAGTVEFLLDDGGEFFFLEMNTRLQVEHPVTELVTGLDLVALQIHVAQGHPLGLNQEDVLLHGHAIEARLYAENPSQGFLPAAGRVECLSKPLDIRFDGGVDTGSDISPFYDPMVAKLIASGPDRETARRKLVRALEETVLFGVSTNRQFLIDALSKETFVTGKATTAFIDETFAEDDLAPRSLTDELAALAALIQYLAARDRLSENIPEDVLGWCSAEPISSPFEYEGLRAQVRALSSDKFNVECGRFFGVVQVEAWSNGRAQFACETGRKTIYWHTSNPAEIYIQMGPASFHLTNKLALPAVREIAAGEGNIAAPLHGAVTEVFVTKGEKVELGARLAVIEAMKMQHDILADKSGRVEDVFVKTGDQVSANAPLFKIDS
ncbi:MAG: acetyl-CoA carboxylase biotin carboxylase subunit [Litorimonas sp.]